MRRDQSPLLTSWNLRDYQTGTWEDGSHECDHRKVSDVVSAVATSGLEGGKKTTGHLQEGFRTVCGKCGARRVDQQIGLEPTFAEHVQVMVEVFRLVRRVLRKDGVVFLNYGDAYACAPNGRKAADIVDDDRTFRDKPFNSTGNGFKAKDLMLMPHRLAIALQADGWWLRQAITWCKPSPMPESVTDRCTSATEMLFMFARQERYFYDAAAIAEPVVSEHGSGNGFKRPARLSFMDDEGVRGNDEPWLPGGTRNKRNWWVLNSQPTPFAHFATMPEALVEPCILAGSSERGCCPECGAPWRRVVEKETRPNAPSLQGKYNGEGKHRTISGGVGNDARVQSFTGWQPTCSHPHSESELVPAVILDPFAGSGTVCRVATRLGRRSIGIELNPEYVSISSRRNSQGGLGL